MELLSLSPTEIFLVIDFILIALISFIFYRSDEKVETYQGKETPIPSPKGSKFLIKSMFYGSLFILLGVVFYPSAAWLSLWSHPLAHIAGALIANLGVLIFVTAKIQLAEHYSPCFNSYVPKSIVQTGIYRIFRHPIYVGNSLIFAGAFVALGSLWIATGLLALILVYRKVALLEEASLKKHFKDYADYARKTPALIKVP